MADFYHMDEEGEPLVTLKENCDWLLELPSGFRAPTIAGDNMLLEVFDEEDSEGKVHAGVQA